MTPTARRLLDEADQHLAELASRLNLLRAELARVDRPTDGEIIRADRERWGRPPPATGPRRKREG